MKLLHVNGYLNGLLSCYDYYEQLLNWNPNIPLIALENKKLDYEFLLLSREENGQCKLLSDAGLGTSEMVGNFKIINKTFAQSTQGVSIKAVWLSGIYKGQSFTVNRDDWTTQEGIKPPITYFPPRCIKWLIEMVFSILILIAIANWI